MDSILKVIEGPDNGQSVRLSPGDTLIGRSARAQLRLSSAGVSVEHAVVKRDGDACYLENLSAHGTQINDTKITGRVRLRVRDRIRVSDDTVLRYESSEGAGVLGRPRMLLAVVAVLFLIAIVVILINPFTPSAPVNDWPRAYNTLTEWVDAQINAGQMTPAVGQLLREGWRLEQDADYKASQDKWWKLQLLLDDPADKTQRFAQAAEEHHNALHDVLTAAPHAEFDSEIMAAALEQFAHNRYNYCFARTPKTGLGL